MPQKLHTNENAQKANKFCTHLGRRRTEKPINLFSFNKASILGGQSKSMQIHSTPMEEKAINSITTPNNIFCSSYLIGDQQDDFRSGGDHSLVYYTCSTSQPALVADCCEGGEEEKKEP